MRRSKNDNLIQLFPDIDSQVDAMTVAEQARELIRTMKDTGESLPPDLWEEIKILHPPERYPREMMPELRPIPHNPRLTLRKLFGLRPLRPKKR